MWPWASDFVGRCTGSGTFQKRKFNAGVIDSKPTIDFNPFDNDQKLDFAPAAGKLYSQDTGGGPITKSELLEHVWLAAQYEWTDRFA